MGTLNSEVQQDDNSQALTSAYEPNSDRIVIPQAASATQDPQSGRWYGPLSVQASVTPPAIQRVDAQSGDFPAGAITDLATLLSLAGTAGDANTVASLMGRLTKIRDVLAATLTVSRVVSSSGGSVPYHALSAASTNATNVKATACQLYGYAISNTASAARFVKFYDKATAPVVGTDTPKHTIAIPANATVIRAFPEGLKFTNGLGWATTTGVADSDAGAVGANDLVVDFNLDS